MAGRIDQEIADQNAEFKRHVDAYRAIDFSNRSAALKKLDEQYKYFLTIAEPLFSGQNADEHKKNFAYLEHHLVEYYGQFRILVPKKDDKADKEFLSAVKSHVEEIDTLIRKRMAKMLNKTKEDPKKEAKPVRAGSTGVILAASGAEVKSVVNQTEVSEWREIDFKEFVKDPTKFEREVPKDEKEKKRAQDPESVAKFKSRVNAALVFLKDVFNNEALIKLFYKGLFAPVTMGDLRKKLNEVVTDPVQHFKDLVAIIQKHEKPNKVNANVKNRVTDKPRYVLYKTIIDANAAADNNKDILEVVRDGVQGALYSLACQKGVDKKYQQIHPYKEIMDKASKLLDKEPTKTLGRSMPVEAHQESLKAAAKLKAGKS